MIKPLLSFGQEIGYLRVNLGTAFKAPPVKNTLAECILANTLLMIRLEPNARNRALLMLLYRAGLWISEVTGLRWRDLVERDGAGQVTVYGKGSKTRVMLLSDNTWITLGEIGRSTAPMTRIRSDDPDNDEYNPDEAGQRKDHCTLPFEHGVLAVSHLSGHLGRDRGTTALDAPVFRFCKGRPLDLSQAHRIVKAAAAPRPRPRSRRIGCAMRTRATASTGARPSTSCKPRSGTPRSPRRADTCTPARQLSKVSRGLSVQSDWLRRGIHRAGPETKILPRLPENRQKQAKTGLIERSRRNGSRHSRSVARHEDGHTVTGYVHCANLFKGHAGASFV